MHVLPGYPVTVNHADFTAFARGVAARAARRASASSTCARRSWAPRTSPTSCSACPARWCSSARAPEGGAGAPLHSNRMRARRGGDRRRASRSTPRSRCAGSAQSARVERARAGRSRRAPRASSTTSPTRWRRRGRAAPSTSRPRVERALRHRGVARRAARSGCCSGCIEWPPRLDACARGAASRGCRASARRALARAARSAAASRRARRAFAELARLDRAARPRARSVLGRVVLEVDDVLPSGSRAAAPRGAPRAGARARA